MLFCSRLNSEDEITVSLIYIIIRIREIELYYPLVVFQRQLAKKLKSSFESCTSCYIYINSIWQTNKQYIIMLVQIGQGLRILSALMLI